MRWGLVALVLCACSIELSRRPRPPVPPPRTTTIGLSISTTTLPSGLRVVVVRDPRASEVSVTMRYSVGALDDGASSGMAHLVEHLMFQQQLAGQPVYAHLEDVATYFNATTSFSATTYVTRAPTAALDKLLEVEAVRLEQRCTTIDATAFAREREVVANELAQRDQATEVFRALHAAVYPVDHPYRRTVGGTFATVGAITREQACAFVDAYYAPGNAVLVVSSSLATADLDAALARMNARLSKRGGTLPLRTELAVARPAHVEVDAPIDENVLVLAWPLPLDPVLQAQVRAVAATLPKLVDDQIAGLVVGLELGDEGAPMIGLAVLPDENESLRQVVDGTRRAVERLPRMFGEARPDNVDEVVFERMRQGAVYNLYAGLEDGTNRDGRLASYMHAGRDPNDALEREVRAVQELSPDEASAIASRYLASNTPSVVTVKASAGRKRGDRLSLRRPIHDLGQRRTPVDPSLAARPSATPTSEPHLGATTHVLPNGLKVVLLPVTAVPTFEARLVFGAGTADEPAYKRGVSLLAANTLTWNLRHLADALAFTRAGGLREVDVSTDRTSFIVQGLASNLDFVLAGLRRWVCDGTYDDTAASYVHVMRRAAKRADDQGLLTDAWRQSLFGANHPYTAAGIVRHANPALTLHDAAEYRNAYFTPDNATLVIAGRFDRALAYRWIEYLFASWDGRAAGHHSVQLMTQAAALAKVDDTALVQIRVALPIKKAGRAQRLVATKMLSDIARDVRYRLGASYTFDADLVETKLASFYLIAGWVDAARAAQAMQLVRDRIAELRQDKTAAARAFVTARERALVQLQSSIGSAAALASRVERDVELSRPPLSDVETAATVRALTLADMTDSLAELDLATGTVLMNGPGNELASAFGALGRAPSYVQPSQTAPVSAPSATVPVFRGEEQRVLRSELTSALTEQPRSRLLLSVSANVTIAGASRLESAFTGYTFSAALGYRYGWHNALGANVSVGRLTSDTLVGGQQQTTALLPINMLAMWHLGGPKRAWGNVLAGMHLDRMTGGSWRSALMYAVEGGYDLIRHRGHRVGLVLRYDNTFNDGEYSALTIGLGYRQ